MNMTLHKKKKLAFSVAFRLLKTKTKNQIMFVLLYRAAVAAHKMLFGVVVDKSAPSHNHKQQRRNKKDPKYKLPNTNVAAARLFSAHTHTQTINC